MVGGRRAGVAADERPLAPVAARRARNGDGRRGSRFTLGGDAPLGASAALITLHDWSRYSLTSTALAGQESRQDRSLVGMALRPVSGNALNVLGKLEWRRTLNPLGGAPGAGTVLGGARRRPPPARRRRRHHRCYAG